MLEGTMSGKEISFLVFIGVGRRWLKSEFRGLER